MINSWEQLMKDLASVGKCFFKTLCFDSLANVTKIN